MKSEARVLIVAILLIVIFFVGRRAFPAGVISTVPEIGPHTPLILVEKSENPQNKMVVFTKLDSKTCAFTLTSGKPVFDEYWLMDGEHFKKVNQLIKNAVTDRFELDRQAFRDRQKFLVHLKDFSELKSDLGSAPTFEVTVKKGASSDCNASVVMKLGPSDHDRSISIDSIYADSEKSVLPPFRKLKSLTLQGKDVATGETIRRTYSAN